MMRGANKMKLRLADMCDLSNIKEMYRNIIERMNKNNIVIWDDFYPCAFFKEDIEKKCLYVLENDFEIVAAMALCDTNSGENAVEWENRQEKAWYIDRLGVNVSYLRQGMGELILKKVIDLARQHQIKYLRLFVVDINKPAIDLYKKCGFKQSRGVFVEKFDDVVLHEYGFEIRV